MTGWRDIASAPRRRTWSYVQRPAHFEMDGCMLCGNIDPDWSEWWHHLWCQNCLIDFIPEHAGLFDGPVGVELCKILGISFDRYDFATGKVHGWDNPLPPTNGANNEG